MIIHPVLSPILQRKRPNVTLLDVRDDVADTDTYTFTACNLGDIGGTANTAHNYADRGNHRSTSRKAIAIIVHGEDAATTFDVSSVTIGGVAGVEQVDRGGGTTAINTAIYTWATDGLMDITNTDIVVTWSESVTACAIGVVLVDNLGILDTVDVGSTQGAGDMTLTIDGTITEEAGQCTIIVGMSCVTGGGTERSQVRVGGAGDCFAPTMLYEGSNAEFDFAGWWTCVPAYGGGGVGSIITPSWSGTGGGDSAAIMLV